MRISRRKLLAAPLVLPAHLALANQVTSTPWPSAVLMATGRPGGTYDVYGPAWGRLAQSNCGIAVAYRASGGAAADILLIEQGAAQLGMTSVTVADEARTGTGNWTAGVKLMDFRALFPMFPSVLQIVTPAASGIARLSELENLGVGVGPDGGSGAVAVPGILAKLGIVPRQMAIGDYAPLIQDMLAGKLAACAFFSAPPVPAIFSVAQTHRLRLIGFTPDEALHVARNIPGLVSMGIPVGTFPGQNTAVASVGTANFAIGTVNLPDSLANAVTLAAMRNQESLARVVPAAATPPQAMLTAPEAMMFHPGAVTALQSLGLNVLG